MSDHDPFPNVKEKLTAPTKKSAFEKSRLEAEAKRLREEAETAAVLKDFVASFDDDPAPSFPSSSSSSTGPASGPRGGGGGFRARSAGRRHFTAGPPRKRNLEAAFERDGAGEEVAGVFGGAPMTMSMGERERERGEREKRRARGGETGLLAWENSAPGGKGDDDSDSETSKPHPKPTLSLTSLPPSTTKPILTALLASTPLRIDSIRIIPAPPPPGPSQPSPSIRKASSALVTLSPETPSSDIDAAVTSLNGRYLGSGFWLSISRHLPSTISTTTPLTTPTANPFNAIAPSAPSSSAHRHHNNHRPPPHRGGFAPPSSYRAPNTTTPSSLQVHVHPPSDLRLLRLIHKTVEGVLKHGAAFEALLMASDGVRADPRFAWLWDARSPPGVYYRWKLWSLITLQRAQPAIEMFEPTPALSALWIPPRRPLRYEFAGSLADIRADEEFTREELLDEEDEEALPPPPPSSLSLSLPDEKGADGKRGYLGVLGRAKLVHLVARIPTATTRVRRGDVGRVMAFAMEHAEGGMGEEVVDVLVGNVLRPLAFTAAARGEGEGEEERERRDNEETHAAKIIGLWVISDVLSNSSLGIRNAWRYRQLFDVALREKGVFAHLGEVYRTPGWGRMKAEKFRRGVVEGVLEWWEKWCIFPQTTQDAFLTSFLTPPTSTSTSTNNTTNNNTPPTTSTGTSTPTPTTTTTTTAPKSKWKTVEAAPSSFNPHTATATATDSDIDGDPMPADSDSDIDGEPMPDDDPMQEDDHDEDEDEDEDVKEMFDDGAAHSLAPPAGSAPRKRMRAEELWADGE